MYILYTMYILLSLAVDVFQTVMLFMEFTLNLMEHRLWSTVVLKCLWLSKKTSALSPAVVNRNLLFQNLLRIA